MLLHTVGSGLPNEAYTKTEIDTNNYTKTGVDQLRATAKSAVLKGNFSLSNTVLTAGMATHTYTGNGTSKTVNTSNITTGVDFVWFKERTTAEEREQTFKEMIEIALDLN